MEEGKAGFRFRVHRLDNDTLIATLVHRGPNGTLVEGVPPVDYDDTGALYYVIVVVLLYGFSILLMIGSSIRKNKADQGVNKYMKDMDKVRQIERRHQKFKARLAMQKKRIHSILGSTRSTEGVFTRQNSATRFNWDASEITSKGGGGGGGASASSTRMKSSATYKEAGTGQYKILLSPPPGSPEPPSPALSEYGDTPPNTPNPALQESGEPGSFSTTPLLTVPCPSTSSVSKEEDIVLTVEPAVDLQTPVPLTPLDPVLEVDEEAVMV